MKFTDEINCNTCKHGYFKDVDISGWHNLCGEGKCYLCAMKYESCSDYEQGEPPKDSEPM